MKLLVENKLVSMGGSSTVKDETGKEVYFVKGRMVSATKVKELRDSNKKVLYKIRNKYFHLLKRSALIYDSEDNLVATVTRKISVKSDFDITGSTGDLAIKGTVIGWNFDVVYEGNVVGHIQRKLRVATDAFEVDVYDKEDAPFLAALVIAIDNITDAATKNRN